MKKSKEAESRPQRRERDREATRAAIIEAGEALFAERGFAGATLDEIANRARANKALVSYYFGGKEGLYDEVVASLTVRVLETVSKRRKPTSDPMADLRKYIRSLAFAFAAHPTFPAILMREYLGGSMQERKRPFHDILQFYRITESIVHAGRVSGAFRAVDPHKLHLTIVGPLVHFTLTIGFRERTFKKMKMRIENPSVGDFAEHLADIICSGLSMKGGKPAANRLAK